MLGAANAGVRGRVGLFDDNNGFYLEYNNGWNVVKRSNANGSVVNTSVAEASWEGKADLDKFFAANPEYGSSLDPTKTQILAIEGQFLGVGEVALYLVFGKDKICIHKFRHANLQATKYMPTINLPLRYEVEQITGDATATMKCVCLTAISSGGFSPIGIPLTVNNGATSVTATNGTAKGILAVRGNDASVSLNLLGYDTLTTSNTALLSEIYLASAVTGGTWTSAGTNAHSEINTTFTGFTSLKKIHSTYIPTQNRAGSAVINELLFTGQDISGSHEIIVLAVTGVTGTANCYGSINYQEIY